MSSETATYIAYSGALVGLVGGAIALFNARKAVLWKRAELANSYLRELSANDELLFACRALDWNGGRLVVPQSLRPLLVSGEVTINHETEALRKSMIPDLTLQDLEADQRLQIYRTALDSLFSWFNLVSSALDRNLFVPRDVDEVGYWVVHIHRRQFLEPFIDAFGYRTTTDRLRKAFAYKRTSYKFG